MKQKSCLRSPELKLLAAVTVLAILFFLPQFLRFCYEKAEWLGGRGFFGVPRPPIPPYAMHIEYLGSGSLPGYRIIRYETDQPADKIQQFYRIELTRRGWYLSCPSTQLEQPECPIKDLSPVVDLMDGYKRDDEPSMVRAIEVTIFKQGEQQVLLVNGNNRLVEVIEYKYQLYMHVQGATSGNIENNITLTPGVYPWPGSDRPTPLPAYP